jgi:hypothetical protein
VRLLVALTALSIQMADEQDRTRWSLPRLHHCNPATARPTCSHSGGLLIMQGIKVRSATRRDILWVYLTLTARHSEVAFRRVQVSSSAFLAAATTVCAVGAMKAWLVVGIWSNEAGRYNALADLVTTERHTGILTSFGTLICIGRGLSFRGHWVTDSTTLWR